MNEYEKLFIDSVWKGLKQRIKGLVYVTIKDNTLKANVKCDEFYFEKIVDNVAEKIILGNLNSRSFIHNFEDEYRSYVKKQTYKRLFY